MNETFQEKKKILFIDDEAINLLGARSLFRRDFTVFTAGSAEEGLHILQTTSMDAVVCDQRMPRMKGTELFSAIADRSRTGVRIILTGYSFDTDVQSALSDGLIDDVMEKPLHVLSLVERINKIQMKLM